MNNRELTPWEELLTYDFAISQLWTKLFANDLCRLGMTSTLFKPALNQVNAVRVVQYAAYGNEAAVLAMLQANPDLLYIKATVKDYSGRTIFGSLLQIALGAGDIWMLHKIMPIIEATKTHALALAQFNEQFGEQDERKILMLAQLDEDLKAVANAISADPCTHSKPTLDATKNVIRVLHEHLDSYSVDVIHKGEHFSLEMLRRVYHVHDQHWNPWDGQRLSCYSVDVIGYVLRAVPAVDAQRFVKGLAYALAVTDDLPRTFQLGNRIFYPLVPNPSVGLGIDFFVEIYYGGALPYVVGGFVSGFAWSPTVEILCGTKTAYLEKFKQQLQHPTDSYDLNRASSHC